jgi:hypothetical protein
VKVWDGVNVLVREGVTVGVFVKPSVRVAVFIEVMVQVGVEVFPAGNTAANGLSGNPRYPFHCG